MSEVYYGDKLGASAVGSRAYEFFREAVEKFPFWREDMKPKLEEVIARYVGTQAQVDLRPDVQPFEEWIAQQLSISLVTDPAGVVTPLNSMGDGWQRERNPVERSLRGMADFRRFRGACITTQPSIGKVVAVC